MPAGYYIVSLQASSLYTSRQVLHLLPAIVSTAYVISSLDIEVTQPHTTFSLYTGWQGITPSPGRVFHLLPAGYCTAHRVLHGLPAGCCEFVTCPAFPQSPPHGKPVICMLGGIQSPSPCRVVDCIHTCQLLLFLLAGY